jgi:hypothetical protein
VGILGVNVKGMAEGFGVRRIFCSKVRGLCVCCTVEGVGGLSAEYFWPDRRRYVVRPS